MVSIEYTVQLNIFNTSIEALQETIDVCGLLRRNSFEFIILEIPSLPSSKCAVDTNSIFSDELPNKRNSKEEEFTLHDALDVLTSRTVQTQCSEIFEYGNEATTSKATVPCHSEKNSSVDNYRIKSFSDGLSNSSPNISNISFDADVNNHSVLKSFLLDNAEMSTSMQAFIYSMDAFLEKQTVADFGLIPTVSDDPLPTVHDSLVSIVNIMVDKVCQTETDDASRVDSVCEQADSAPEQNCPFVQPDDLREQSCTPVSLLEMPEDSAFECCFSDDDNDNASFMTASGLEMLDQDLQSRDVSHSDVSSITHDGSYIDAETSGDDHHRRSGRNGVPKNRKISSERRRRSSRVVSGWKARRFIVCQFRNCSNSFRVNSSRFKLLRHAKTHNSNAFSCVHCGFAAHLSRQIHTHHRESPCRMLGCKQHGQKYPECVVKYSLNSDAVNQLFKCCFPNYNS